MTSNCSDGDNIAVKTAKWVNWITIVIGFSLIFIVMIAVFFQMKKGLNGPVYVINLLVSDLVQLGSRTILDPLGSGKISFLITVYAFMVSVGFMVCISCERYLVVAKPLWYRFRRNIKKYVVVCIVVWILPVFYLIMHFVSQNLQINIITFIVFFLLPFPLLTFFLVGTIKALSGALNVPADEKRRIAAIQVAVLIIYTLLYLPIVIWLLHILRNIRFEGCDSRRVAAYVCIFLSPLADTTLYLLCRKSIMDKFLASLCSTISNNQETSSTDYESRTAINTETV